MTECLCQSKAALILLCFMIEDYETAYLILSTQNQSEIDSNFLHSLFKICNLLMHPSMHNVFISMGCKGELGKHARMAYGALLMFLPLNRMTSSLFLRAKEISKN